MTKIRVLYYDCLQYTQENLTELKDSFEVYTIEDPRYDESYSQTMKNGVEAIFLPLGFSFNAQRLGKFPKLRVIASATTTKPDCVLGNDEGALHIIWLDDSQFLEDITCTAEHALGLMHAIHRRIPSQNENVKTGHWSRYDIEPPCKMLSHMEAVVWGHGRVGKHLSYMCRRLFNHVTYIEEGNSDEWVNARLAKAEVLFLTMSVVGTQPVVTRDKLEHLPRSAIVVNVSRGEVLDTEALLDLLHQEHLDGAALDVLPGDHSYTYDKTSPIYEQVKEFMKSHSNLIVTPHIAGSTKDAWHDTQKYVIDRVKEILL